MQTTLYYRVYIYTKLIRKMNDIERALSDIDHIRSQLAASKRFEGFTPPIIALTGVLAILMAVYFSADLNTTFSITYYFVLWILVAIISGLLIATDAILRARKAHQQLADRMLLTALRQFAPAGLVGAAFGLFVLFQAQDSAWLLPGLWQMLVALGIYAALPNLPPRMIWPAAFYFVAGVISLMVSQAGSLSPWAMGLPFGLGQLFVAGILFDARRNDQNGQK
jgi:hypothetical protein